MLAPDGRLALRVGSEVVYLAGGAVSASTMTPYDVAAVRLVDGMRLAGTPPADAGRYLAALRADPGSRVAALTGSDDLATASDVVQLVERLAKTSWTEAEARVRASGGLVGAYPAEPAD